MEYELDTNLKCAICDDDIVVTDPINYESYDIMIKGKMRKIFFHHVCLRNNPEAFAFSRKKLEV
jgi:hypothetical protein